MIVVLAAMLAAFDTAWAQQAKARPVTVVPVTKENLRTQVQLIGTSVALRESALSPRVAGLVTRVAVDVGQEIVAGDLVLELNQDLAELDLKAVVARESEARARLRDAERVRDELRRLAKGSHASRTRIDSAIAQVEIARAVLEGARAERARAEEMLERHRLVAPFAGMVVAKNVEVGEWIKPDEAAVVMVALDTIRVEAPVPQGDYDRVRQGASVHLRFDALPGQGRSGRVVAKVASGDPRSRNFPILIDLPNPGHRIAPGMSARVMVELDEDSEPSLTVPRDAVMLHSDGRREVWMVQPGDQGGHRVQPIAIQTGRAIGDRLEVVSGGLAPGDSVVLLGNENLKPGQAVTPK